MAARKNTYGATRVTDTAPSTRANLYLIVPVFNELENLDRLFDSFHQAVAEFSHFRMQVVLVDDGSTDGTLERATVLASGLDCVVLKNPVNGGPGTAFGRGFEYLSARLAASDWVVTLEGDNTSRRELLRTLFKRAEEGYDVVL